VTVFGDGEANTDRNYRDKDNEKDGFQGLFQGSPFYGYAVVLNSFFQDLAMCTKRDSAKNRIFSALKFSLGI
jgi:hypothetical protein